VPELLFTLYGRPHPQKQYQISRGKLYNPSYGDRLEIRKKILEQLEFDFVPLKGPIHLQLFFYFAPPASFSKKKRAALLATPYHVIRPDFDNLAYLITNAVKTIAIEDDCQVCDATIKKRWGEEDKTIILIKELEESGCA